MSAWVVSGGTLQRAELPVPTPPPGYQLVAVRHCGVCGSDLAKLSIEPISAPDTESWIPGHEIVGTSADITQQHLLAVDPLMPCEDCEACARGSIHLCSSLRRIGWDLPGGFAQYVAVPEGNLVPVADPIDPAVLVLADPLAVAIHGVRCGLGGERDGSLAVVGAGTVGVCTAAYAASVGLSVTVYGMRRTPHRLPAAFAGVRFESPSARPEPSFDAVVDAGEGRNDQPLRYCLRLVRDGGTVIVQNAYLPGIRLAEDLRAVFRRSIRIAGSFSFCREHGAGDFREAVQVLVKSPPWAQELVRGSSATSNLDEVVRAGGGRRFAKPIISFTTGRRHDETR